MSTHCQPSTARLGSPPSEGQRDRFVADIRGRFRPIRGRIRHFAAVEDGFGLRDGARNARLANGDDDDTPGNWPPPPDGVRERDSPQAKARSFVGWLRQALTSAVLEPADPSLRARLRNASTDRDIRGVLSEWDHWTTTYLRGAAREGWDAGGNRLRIRGGEIASTALDDDEPLSAIFDIGVSPRQLRALYLQPYQQLWEITNDAAAQQVRETVTQAFAEGIGPREMASRLTQDVRTLQHTRAEALARTHTINAHTTHTLDRYEAAGVETVSHVEWTDSADARVCPFCRRLDGVDLTIDEMRSTHVQWRGQIYRLMPPAHVNGRCTPLPNVDGSAITTPLRERVPGRIVTTSADPTQLTA